MKVAPRWTAIVVAGLGALAVLPAVVLGLHFVYGWVRLHTSDGPCFDWNYLTHGAGCLLFGALVISAALRAILKPALRMPISALRFFVGLVATHVLPNIGPRFDMADTMQRILGHADRSLSDWDEAHGKFPQNQQELHEALASRPLSEPAVFFMRGQTIPYTVCFVPNAAGPALETVPSQPGAIVYAVSSDYKEYWLTVTSLRDPIGGPVALEHAAGLYELEPVWVVNRKHHAPGSGWQPFIE